jgi:hypothetical protein
MVKNILTTKPKTKDSSMKKILLMIILFFLSVNSFADEYDDYASSEAQKNGTSKKAGSPLVGIGVNILTGSNYEFRTSILLEQNITLYLISQFVRSGDDDNSNYNFSLGAGASFSLPSSLLPTYAGATFKYIHPGENTNGAAINAFAGVKALFLNAFEIAGELGVYFEYIHDAGTNISLRPAVYLSWYFI